MDYEYDIFVSHSSKNKPVARHLALELKFAGFKVWFDEWKIGIGDDVYLEIERGIEQSKSMLILMSNDFFQSEWIDFERSVMAFRDPSNKSRTLFPVLIEDCKIPDTLSRLHRINLITQKPPQIADLIKEIGGQLGIKAKRVLHKVKVEPEKRKGKHSLQHGKKGTAYQRIVSYALNQKLSALLFFDIDGFSYINAKYDVATGQRVLKLVNDILTTNAPKDAIVTLWHADEFVCLAPNYEERDALDIAYQLVSDINNYNWDKISKGLYISVSCGISGFRTRGSQKEVEWIERAILGARAVKVKGGNSARIGERIQSTAEELANKTVCPLDYLDQYGS